jgi:hypothetical protein
LSCYNEETEEQKAEKKKKKAQQDKVRSAMKKSAKAAYQLMMNDMGIEEVHLSPLSR